MNNRTKGFLLTAVGSGVCFYCAAMLRLFVRPERHLDHTAFMVSAAVFGLFFAMSVLGITFIFKGD